MLLLVTPDSTIPYAPVLSCLTISPVATVILAPSARVFFVISWIIAAIFYLRFYKKQDELIQRWHQYIFCWGAGGFLIFGSLISIASPFFNFNPTFYEFFVAFAIGTAIGGYRFDKNYL